MLLAFMFLHFFNGALAVLTECRFHFKQGGHTCEIQLFVGNPVFRRPLVHVRPFITGPVLDCPGTNVSDAAPEAMLRYELGTPQNGLVDLISITARNPSARLKVIGDSTCAVSLIYCSRSNRTAFLQKNGFK